MLRSASVCSQTVSIHSRTASLYRPIRAGSTKIGPEPVKPITLSGKQWNEVPIADQAKQDPFHSMPSSLLTAVSNYRITIRVMLLNLHRWSC